MFHNEMRAEEKYFVPGSTFDSRLWHCCGVTLSRLKIPRNANGEPEKCRELSKLIAFILLLCLAFLRLQVAARRDPQNNHLEGSIGGWEVIWVNIFPGRCS